VLRPPVPPAANLQLSLVSLPLARPAQILRLASSACTPARPVANPPARIGFVSCARPARTSDSHRLFRASGRPRAILRARARRSWFHRACARQSWFHPACAAWSFPRLRPTTYLRLASNVVLWLGGRPHTACALCCPCSPGGFPPPDRSGCFHPPASPAVRLLGLRLAIATPAEPLMHSLLQPNLASPAEPSMSIPFPPAFASSGITQLNNFRLSPAFAISGASSDPSRACARGFTLCPG